MHCLFWYFWKGFSLSSDVLCKTHWIVVICCNRCIKQVQFPIFLDPCIAVIELIEKHTIVTHPLVSYKYDSHSNKLVMLIYLKTLRSVTLCKIYQKTVFFWTVFSYINLYGKLWLRENPYSAILYSV